MYIEFALPMDGPGSKRPGLANAWINQEMQAWSDRYKIPYNTKVVKLKKRITFDDDRHYEFFAISWNPSRHWLNYRIITDLNNKT